MNFRHSAEKTELFSAETETLPKVIDQYSAENETCRNSSNCCFRRRNRNRISVGLYFLRRFAAESVVHLLLPLPSPQKQLRICSNPMTQQCQGRVGYATALYSAFMTVVFAVVFVIFACILHTCDFAKLKICSKNNAHYSREPYIGVH